ncbi:Nucleotidyltransferase domain protein [uncultured archaeon]|nr:Nucleotidyltransferase domain protein [uncultured archaeon]
MKALEEIKKILAEHKGELEDKFKVKEIGVFGSYVRGEQQKQSDVDILVEFYEPVGLFKFIELEDYLEKLLKIKVDVVSKKALKPHIGEHILREVVYA